jgi:signal transduction histidine kinase
MILVDDTGDGMNKDTLNNIYERFNSSNHHGTGLGIPICKELLEQMDGSIEISSEEGKGTTVWIIIPCKAYDIVRK